MPPWIGLAECSKLATERHALAQYLSRMLETTPWSSMLNCSVAGSRMSHPHPLHRHGLPLAKGGAA